MYGTITAKDGLRLRKGPNAKTVTLDLMPFGDRVEIIRPAATGWAYVAWLPAKGARLEGFAATQYIQLDQPKPAPQLIPEPTCGFDLVPPVLGIIAIVVLGVIIWMGFR